jgi:hypothetical protein
MKSKVICFSAAALYAIIVIASAISLSANPKLDVVANYAMESFKSFEEIIQLNDYDKQLYNVYSPDGTEILSFGESVRLTVDVGCFTTAAFCPDKFGGEGTLEGSRLTIAANNVKGVNAGNGSNIIDTFENVLRSNRHALEYHTDKDLFELHLGGGNAFRWAKDWRTNTQGMTFILNPQPFVEAGLELENLEGWRVADIDIMHGPESSQTVLRLLKNYTFAVK